MVEQETNRIIERLNQLQDSYCSDVVVYLIVRKNKTKEIIASKLLKNFTEDPEGDVSYVG